jgi:hypothetical protein
MRRTLKKPVMDIQKVDEDFQKTSLEPFLKASMDVEKPPRYLQEAFPRHLKTAKDLQNASAGLSKATTDS